MTIVKARSVWNTENSASAITSPYITKLHECTLFHTLSLDTQYFYLFGVLRRFQHCTGHIMTVRWKGRGKQYRQLVKVLYCKLPNNSKQLPAFPALGSAGKRTPISEVGGESVTTLSPWPLNTQLKIFEIHTV